jgi:hypothetical protein
MNKIFGISFTIACLVTAAASNSLLGVGMWFWIILATGIFVGASQFVPALSASGAAAASLLAVLSVCAVVLTLLAATIGGSFELNGGETLLVFGFAMIAISGFLVARINKKAAVQASKQSQP